MDKSVSLLKAISAQIAAALVILLAIGPFIHAHYGASKVTGMHLDGITVMANSAGAQSAPSITQDSQQESAAVGVETSFARQMLLDVEEKPQTLLIVAALVVALPMLVNAVDFRPSWQRQPPPDRSLSPGFPPLPHAPPTTHR